MEIELSKTMQILYSLYSFRQLSYQFTKYKKYNILVFNTFLWYCAYFPFHREISEKLRKSDNSGRDKYYKYNWADDFLFDIIASSFGISFKLDLFKDLQLWKNFFQILDTN